MSTMVTDLSRRVLEVNPSGGLVAAFGLVLITLLVILLLQKEILRAWEGPRLHQWLPVLNVVIVPLIISFAMLLIFRMASLVRFG